MSDPETPRPEPTPPEDPKPAAESPAAPAADPTPAADPAPPPPPAPDQQAAQASPPAPDQQAAQASPPPPPAAGGTKPADKKLIAGLLAIILGGFGVHKFYLGYTQEGAIMLAIMLVVGFGGTAITCGLGAPLAMVTPVIGLIEGILYLTKSDEEFVATYVTGRKPWF